jgi:hypothetical protein
MSLRCFIQEQSPVPGSAAHAVHYPACEWVGDEGKVDPQHPLNRFVCSWLTSDVSALSRCDEVLHAVGELEKGTRQTWFVDGDAFQVDLQVHGVQFNPSHVGPDDVAYWKPAAGRFALSEVATLMQGWRNFLETSHPH